MLRTIPRCQPGGPPSNIPSPSHGDLTSIARNQQQGGKSKFNQEMESGDSNKSQGLDYIRFYFFAELRYCKVRIYPRKGLLTKL